jgi:hypothetical protein
MCQAPVCGWSSWKLPCDTWHPRGKINFHSHGPRELDFDRTVHIDLRCKFLEASICHMADTWHVHKSIHDWLTQFIKPTHRATWQTLISPRDVCWVRGRHVAKPEFDRMARGDWLLFVRSRGLSQSCWKLPFDTCHILSRHMPRVKCSLVIAIYEAYSACRVSNLDSCNFPFGPRGTRYHISNADWSVPFFMPL